MTPDDPNDDKPAHTHATPEAQARCYACSHPEKLTITDEDRLLAQQLVADGNWYSTSNRYHMIKRVVVPPFDEVVTFKDGVPDWLQKVFRWEYERGQFSWRRMAEGEERTLTVGQFKAFKQAGGQAA